MIRRRARATILGRRARSGQRSQLLALIARVGHRSGGRARGRRTAGRPVRPGRPARPARPGRRARPRRPAPPADGTNGPDRADRPHRADRPPTRPDRAGPGRPAARARSAAARGRRVARLRRVMANAMAPLGGHSGAYVVDLANGQVLFDDDRYGAAQPGLGREALHADDGARRASASDGTLTTSVYARRHARRRRRLPRQPLPARRRRPDVRRSRRSSSRYDGVGTSVDALALKADRATALRKIKGSIIGDESYFDSLRGGPSTDFAVDPNLVG